MRFSTLNRKLHRWGAIISALPILVILISGIILQLKKDYDWIQPPSCKGKGQSPVVSFDRILEAASTVEEAKINGWSDIDRLDVQPGKGLVKVQAKNSWEIQVDTETGEILQSAYRLSDMIEDLHDGQFFHASVKMWVFLPSGIILLLLWISGIYLFLLPYLKRRRT